MNEKAIKKALISVFNKNGTQEIIKLLNKNNIEIYSTGGTYQYIVNLGVKCTKIEDLTGFSEILSGRVKTLHPKVFGGILARTENSQDISELAHYQIPTFDLVMIDLYPFADTLNIEGITEEEIIEKIDICGVAMLRAAAKNFNDVVVISSKNQYQILEEILQKSTSTLSERRKLALQTFQLTADYDKKIFEYFAETSEKSKKSEKKVLRYGENPHQKANFVGDLEAIFSQLSGKELSYNNLLDIDAAVDLMADFDAKTPTFAILKHNNACGCATATSLHEAYKRAFEADTISAFGGVLIANQRIDLETAQAMDSLFFEILIAPNFDENALHLLQNKKNRIILHQKEITNNHQNHQDNHQDNQQDNQPKTTFRTLLNGVISQEKDLKNETEADLTFVTTKKPSQEQIKALLLANKLVKHSKSNAIILANASQMLSSGVGQTSRIDALKHAIEKAAQFGMDLKGAVMASDAFFPFPDCVEIAHNAGISAVIQPGGSIKDKDSIAFCDNNKIAMVFTGIRHFKH